MAGKTYPWVRVESVAWAEGWQYTRGTFQGLPLLAYHMAPRDKLATYRQLRAKGLRPGGQSPVAVLYGRHNRSGKTWFANLYLIERAKPVRPMTKAKWRALALANFARRFCPQCTRDVGYVLPRSLGVCFTCFEANESDNAAAVAQAA